MVIRAIDSTHGLTIARKRSSQKSAHISGDSFFEPEDFTLIKAFQLNYMFKQLRRYLSKDVGLERLLFAEEERTTHSAQRV